MSGSDAGVKQLGESAQIVLEFLGTMERLVSGATQPLTAEYWEPLARFVAVDEFERLVPENAFSDAATASDDDPWTRTVMDWPTYRECFELWASSSPTYENVIRRIAEFPGLVYLEVEEHHIHGDNEHIFNSLSIYEFNGEGKICRIRVTGAAEGLVIPPA